MYRHTCYSCPLLFEGTPWILFSPLIKMCVEINIDYVHVNLVFINNELLLNQ